MPIRHPAPPHLRFPSAWIIPVFLLLAVDARGESTDAGLQPNGTFLTSTSWSAAAYSRRAGGTLCWLTGQDGSLRIEVGDGPIRPSGSAPAAGDDPLEKLESLLTWTGEGWTMILAPDDRGTLNEWGKEWRQIPKGLAQMVRLVTTALGREPGQRPEFAFAAFAGPRCGRARIPRPGFLAPPRSPERCEKTWRYQLESLELEAQDPRPGSGYRGNMVARGRGTGGRGEVVTLDRFGPGGPAGYGMMVTSSRRPGTLRLEPPRNLPVKTPEPEVFLPLWPLSQFLESR